MSSPPPFRDDDEPFLDEIIRRAARCNVNRQAVGRLADFWQSEMERRTDATSWWVIAAAASVAIVAGTLILLVVNQRGHAPPMVVKLPQHESRAPRSRSHNIETEIATRRLPDAGDGSEPTPYELLVMHSALSSVDSPQGERSRSVRRRIVRRLKELERNDGSIARAVASELDLTISDLEKELGRLCFVLRGPERETAVALLSSIATEESLEALLRLWAQPRHQKSVAPAIARLGDVDVLAQCYLQAGLPQSRRILAKALVGQLAPRDVRLLVWLYTRAPRSTELLGALRTADESLAEALFGELDAEERMVRIAAAHTLAALNRPDVSQRLIERVASGRRRQEALVALAASDEPLAAAFVSQAARNPILASALQSAMIHSRTSRPWYGG